MSIQSYARINGVDPASVEDLVTYRPASCRYGIGAFTTSATSMAATTVTWNQKGFDDANAMNTSTGVWTCPYPGVYLISFYCGILVAGVQTNLILLKNGAQALVNGRGGFGTTSGYQEMPCVMIDRLAVGDTIAAQVAVGVASLGMRTGAEMQFYVGFLHP